MVPPRRLPQEQESYEAVPGIESRLGAISKSLHLAQGTKSQQDIKQSLVVFTYEIFTWFLSGRLTRSQLINYGQEAIALLHQGTLTPETSEQLEVGIIQEMYLRFLLYLCFFLTDEAIEMQDISFLQRWLEGTVYTVEIFFRIREENRKNYENYSLILSYMSELLSLSDKSKTEHTEKELLEALFNKFISPNRAIMPQELMKKIGERIQQVPLGEIPPAMKLHRQLESAGAYERLKQLDPRRAILLQTYLTTDKSALDVGKEVGLGSRSRATELLHSAMEVAFYALPDQQQAEYGNKPANALRTRAAQQTTTKSERIKQAIDKRKNPETNKLELSDTHRQHITEGNLRRWRSYREQKATVQEQPTDIHQEHQPQPTKPTQG